MMAQMQVVFDMQEMRSLMRVLGSLTDKDKSRVCKGAMDRGIIETMIKTYGFMASADMLLPRLENGFKTP